MDTRTPPDGTAGAAADRDSVPGPSVPGPSAPEVPGFRVDRLLGVGGSAAVWLVRDDDAAPFALKVPANEGEGAANAFQTRREVNILARLEHPHLVKLHAVLETDQGPGLLSGYAAGGSAAGLVAARGAVQPGEAVSVLVGIAAALSYLHARGAAHGDVSPGNILFTAEGKPLLADFGSGRLLGEPGAPRLGTPGFQAPESTGGAQDALDTAGDIYALAAVGWFLLTGQVPPPSRERPPLSILVPGVGRELPALLEAGLAEDSSRRPAADEFASAAYRGAPALPVDLVAAAHPEVHPELLTRRTRSAASGDGERKHWWQKPWWKKHRAAGVAVGLGSVGRAEAGLGGVGLGGAGRGSAGLGGAGRGSTGLRPSVRQRSGQGTVPQLRATDRDSRQQGRQTWRRRRSRTESAGSRVVPVIAAGVVVLVLVLAGIALAAPDLLRFDTRASGIGSRGGTTGGSPDATDGTLPEPTARTTPALPLPGVPAPPPAVPAPVPSPAPAPSPSPLGTGPGTAFAESVESLRVETAAGDPAQALPALAELRSRAFSTADPGLLEHVNAPGSEAMLADQEQIGRLADQGHALAGLATEVEVLDHPPPETAAAAGNAELRVRMRVSPYTHVDGSGAVLRQEQGQQQEVLLVLVRKEGMWRISRVLAPG